MRAAGVAVVFGMAASVVVAAQQNPPAQPPPARPPASAPTPAQPSGAQPAAAQPTGGPARAFTAPVGLLFNTVRPERVADFEKVIAYLQAALEKSRDPRVQAQARGWRMYKASEPGPNNTVMYVFVLDPTVPGAEYGFGRILAEAYPDTAQLQEIWRLYTGSVTTGGSLLNLSPIMPALPDQTTPNAPAATPPRPLDANPNTPGR